MGKTIKIIDLLNKIANGEELPEEIRFENYIYIWRDIQKDYFCEQINHSLESIIGEYLFGNLNLEVEIIEEDKEIEKIDNAYYHKTQPEQNQIFKNKINEIINYLMENKQ